LEIFQSAHRSAIYTQLSTFHMYTIIWQNYAVESQVMKRRLGWCEITLQLCVISNLTKSFQQFLNCNVQMAGETGRHAGVISLICIEFIILCRECIIGMQGLLSFISRIYMHDALIVFSNMWWSCLKFRGCFLNISHWFPKLKVPSVDHFGSSMLAELVCFLVFVFFHSPPMQLLE
jgi:hypothetical protein